MSQKPKDRNQHIKVFARVRPRNSQELRSHIVVDCVNSKEIAVKDKGQTKNFAFDRVFGPESKQVEVYKAVVAPLISEVLQGYNCTVFAYGQTGTGKTFTMVGDRTKDLSGGWESDPLCGIVPRTLDHLFDELKVRAEEYTVRVSFLELYNEELCDLLAPADNDDTKTLRLFEDSMKKGSVIVAGLEERTVYEKNDVYPILEAGSLRRQTAPTLMNASSSRSHTIFTITVHVKVTTPEGEDLFKTGKLNLVDLAGSENIGRSGAVDMRAREAGNINQSLLTLGRVITSLVERTPHVPYRESKLTRILQDSLGGRTKTSIIATVSPAMCNLEETLSTFDYAHRARNITNKPEINQKMSKQVLLKNYLDEIERLRRELMAAREKHGVYLQNEDYNGMLMQIDNLNKDLVNKITLLKVREDELAKQEDIMQSLNSTLFETKSDLDRNQELLKAKEEALKERESALQELNRQAQLLLRTADEATEDSKKLHDRLDRARMVHSQNEQVVEKFKSKFLNSLNGMKSSTQNFQVRGAEMIEALVALNAGKTRHCREHEQDVASVVDGFLLNLDMMLTSLNTNPIKQLAAVKAELMNNGLEMKSLGKDLTDLSSTLLERKECWQALREEHFRSLTSQLMDEVRQQKELAQGLETAHNTVQQNITTLQQLPSDVMARSQMEQEALARLEAKRSDLRETLECVWSEHEALLKRGRDALSELTTVSREIQETEKQMEKTKQEAMEAAVTSANQRSEQLLQIIASLVQINRNLVARNETVVPTVTNLHENELKETEQIHEVTTEKLEAFSNRCQLLHQSQDEDAESTEEAIREAEKARVEATTVIAAFRNCSKTMAEEKEKQIVDSHESATLTHQQLGSEMSDFCEQMFANIHDRCTELKVHLKEEFMRDEKTGNTPQRKDFNYPKRLVTTGKFIEQENIPPSPRNISNNLSVSD